MSNLKDMNKDNCYDYLYKLVTLVLDDVSMDMHKFTDICLAICTSDENVGTNHIELDIDKFFVIDDRIWGRLFSAECVCSISNVSPLPKIQKLRVISDALMLCLLNSGKNLTSSFNCEATRLVAQYMGVSEHSCTRNDSSFDEVWKSLSEIRDLYIKEEIGDTVVHRLADFTNEIGARIKLRNKIQLPKEYESVIGMAFSNIEYNDVEYTNILEKNFVKELNDTLIVNLLNIDSLNTAYYIIRVKSTIANKYLLCLTSEVYRKLFLNKRLSNTLSMVFNFSIESTSDIKSTCILLLIMYCGSAKFTNMLFKVAMGGI